VAAAAEKREKNPPDETAEPRGREKQQKQCVVRSKVRIRQFQKGKERVISKALVLATKGTEELGGERKGLSRNGNGVSG